MEGFAFIQNSMQNSSSGCVSSLHFSLISGSCVCQQLHPVSWWEPVCSLWQLCSLCRIISLLQAVVIGWIFKLFWQKELLPAQGERWKWTPHCAETWTPWHFLQSTVQLPPAHCAYAELNCLSLAWPGPYELHPLLSWCYIYSSESCTWLLSVRALKV